MWNFSCNLIHLDFHYYKLVFLFYMCSCRGWRWKRCINSRTRWTSDALRISTTRPMHSMFIWKSHRNNSLLLTSNNWHSVCVPASGSQVLHSYRTVDRLPQWEIHGLYSVCPFIALICVNNINLCMLRREN